MFSRLEKACLCFDWAGRLGYSARHLPVVLGGSQVLALPPVSYPFLMLW